MKTGHYIAVIAIAVISGMVGASFSNHKSASVDKKETVFERVMRTRTIRCAYTPYPPAIIKDANTGKLSGLTYDIVNEIGKQLSLKVEWTTEVAPAGMLEGFASNQYDAICVGYSRNPARATKADFTNAFIYLPNSIYVRADDNRFDGDIHKLNSPEYRFTTVDGEVSSFTIKNDFPKAQVLSMSEGAISDTATRLLNVVDKKSDAVIMDDMAVVDFMKANPGKVKALTPPVTVFGGNILIPQNEYPLKIMLDSTIGSLLENGFIKRTILKYSDGYGYLMPADPYNPGKIQ